MRRIPLSRRSHVTGYGCFGSGAIEHESALERDFVILTSFADPDAVIVSQPITIRFEDEGCQRGTRRTSASDGATDVSRWSR